jgi:hypothetical protein
MSSIPQIVRDRLRETQVAALEAVERYGNPHRAAKKIGEDPSSFAAKHKRALKEAAKIGWAPGQDMAKPAAPGFGVKGTSTLYTMGEDGEKVAAQWVKTTREEERQAQAMREAALEMAGSIPRLKPSKPPGTCDSDLLNLYVLTDYHLGMLAWHEETGADWDLSIAEDMLVRWMHYAISNSPDAETGYFANIGDLLHWDGLEALTPSSGHILDADTRFQKLVRSAIRVLRQCIDLMLQKHQRVVVLMAEGNHDLASSVWLREFFHALYENEPRVTVDQSADPYYCYEHGSTSLFFHHGHRRKLGNIQAVFAAKFREILGRTKYSYAHLGHLHHKDAKELELMEVEQHPTLAAADAHASRGGWLSKRSAAVITYHKRYGEVWRHSVKPEMIAA